MYWADRFINLPGSNKCMELSLRDFFAAAKANPVRYLFRISLIEAFHHSANLFRNACTSDIFILRLGAMGYARLLCLHNCNVNFTFETSVFMKTETSLGNWCERRIVLTVSRSRWWNPRLQRPREKHAVNEFSCFVFYCDSIRGELKFLPHGLYYRE